MKAPKNRIKPTFLREIKTEALLVFIRATLITYFENILNINNKERIKLTQKYNKEFTVKKLFDSTDNILINSTYLSRTILIFIRFIKNQIFIENIRNCAESTLTHPTRKDLNELIYKNG